MQHDLADKARGKLSFNHSWAAVSMSGRDMTISGNAPSQHSVISALELVRDLDEVRVVIDSTKLPPVADPFTLSIVKENSRILLSGFAPFEDMRRKFIDSVRATAPETEIEDNVAIARGMPDGFLEALEYSISLLPSLSTAKIELSSNMLEIEGVAAGLDEYDRVIAKLESDLPASVSITSLDILPPTISPYYWAAVHNGKSVRISGLVPNSVARSEIEKVIREQLPKKEIRNEMRIAAGAPSEFKVATDFATGFLGFFSKGKVAFEDHKFTVSGTAKSPDDFELANAMLDRLPRGYALSEKAVEPASVSPYVWRVERDVETLTVDGFVPSTDVKRVVLASAMNLFPDLSLVENLEIASGANAAFEDAAQLSLETLKHLRSGEAILKSASLHFSGTPRSSSDYQKLLQLAANEIPGIEISNSILALPVNPYRWTVSNTGSGIVVSGYAMNAEDAENVVATVKSVFADAKVIDKQKVASGAPSGFGAIRKFLIGQLSKLEAGQANLVGNSISIIGRASSEQIAVAVDAELRKKAPKEFFVSTNILWPVPGTQSDSTSTVNEAPVADPYRWSLSKLPSGVTVLGNVSDKDDRQAILQIVREQLSISEISDRQVIATGKHKGFDDVRNLLVKLVKLLEAGQANIIGNKTTITGRAKNANVRGLIERSLKTSLPPGYLGSVNLTIPPSKKETAAPVLYKFEAPVEMGVEDCQAAIIAAIDGRKIQFETSRAAIRSASEPILDSVAAEAAKCPDTVIEVIGHTDSKGKETYNQRLSESRAKAVLTFLVSRGLSKTRLKFKGLGEAAPIASNKSEAGRAQNRRIEFSVEKK